MFIEMIKSRQSVQIRAQITLTQLCMCEARWNAIISIAIIIIMLRYLGCALSSVTRWRSASACSETATGARTHTYKVPMPNEARANYSLPTRYENVYRVA